MVAVTHVVYEAEGWGVGELVGVDDRVVWHELPWPRPGRVRPGGTGGVTDPSQTPTRPGVGVEAGVVVSHEPSRGDRGFVAEVVRLLQAYFAGERVDFADVEVALHDETAFGLRMAEELRRVPRGEVVSYGELALLAGRPRAARAAGTFCARCALAPIVPLHRVVSVNGLGGFGSLGADYKRRLLALEGVTL